MQVLWDRRYKIATLDKISNALAPVYCDKYI